MCTVGHGADSCLTGIYLVLTTDALRDTMARLGYSGGELLSAKMTHDLVILW